MKKGLFYLAVSIASLFLLTSFSSREYPQDPIRGGKKHISMVKVVDGKETKLDTVIEAGNIFVWKGDTIGADLKWISEDDLHLDHDSMVSKFGKFEYVIKTNDDKEDKNVVMFLSDDGDTNKLHKFMVKKGNGKNVMFIGDNKKIHEFKSSGNTFWVDDEGNQTVIHSGHMPKIIKEKDKGNVIDLSDPNIISFKKKKLSGGREKIEIIRNEATEEDGEEVGVFFDESNIQKEIKVIRKGDNTFTIFEGDEDELDFTDEDGNLVKVKEIKKGNGSIIHIKEIKEGDAKKIKVTVTEEKEKKEENKQESN